MYSVRSHHSAILVGAALIFSTLACSTQGLGAIQPTPTLFVFPTLVPTPVPVEPTAVPPVAETTDASASLPTEASGSSVALDVCALYTQAEIETLYGEPVSIRDNNTTTPLQDGNEAHLCVYITPTGRFVTITVIPYESAEKLAQAWKDTQGQMPPDVVTIDGLGEEAIYLSAETSAMLTARQGIYMVSVMLVDGGNDQGTMAPPMDDKTKLQRAKTITQTALSRLPK